MRATQWIATLALSCAAWAPAGGAHEGDTARHGAGALHAEASAAGNVTVEGSVVVNGTVRDLQGWLYRVELWPAVFTDARAVTAAPDTPPGDAWSMDFVRFGHAHDFRLSRAGGAVVLTLADESHGLGRFAYRLAPLDAQRSIFVVRFEMGTPPTLTQAQALALLREKAAADLADFARLTTAASAAAARR